MIFSNLILVFSISLQLGSYRMMIDNTLKSYTGHMQIQRQGYNEEPKMRSSIDDIIPLADEVRRFLAATEGEADLTSHVASWGRHANDIIDDALKTQTKPGELAEGMTSS